MRIQRPKKDFEKEKMNSEKSFEKQNLENLFKQSSVKLEILIDNFLSQLNKQINSGLFIPSNYNKNREKNYVELHAEFKSDFLIYTKEIDYRIELKNTKNGEILIDKKYVKIMLPIYNTDIQIENSKDELTIITENEFYANIVENFINSYNEPPEEVLDFLNAESLNMAIKYALKQGISSFYFTTTYEDIGLINLREIEDIKEDLIKMLQSTPYKVLYFPF